MNDPVKAPSHYVLHGYECSKVAEAIIEASDFTPWQACCFYSAFQYLWRCGMKNGKEDVDKLIVYAEWLREAMEEGEK